ncbi:heavy-metal-associated domain-containing protein [Microbacterium sp. ET2]|uniref:heavy-metal-associated domain-containing protein n=1 Tax=Microbacterium albipurpureum TaxID=3050384 RepID=UPI00259D0C50|nr:heavy-metal-associated domain-containing protein [Microbacterium sp. ET2 (Ac-2212)]WJL94793.1 heavy-metal-associated domain-containing protein [Microbacterium sp. ET2 (Ac-2212)]
MNAPVRLGLYAGGLALVFGASFGVAALVAPDAPSSAAETAEGAPGSHAEAPHSGPDTAPPGVSGLESGVSTESGGAVTGVTASDRGYTLSAVDAPAETGDAGTLSFEITGPDGDAVTEYDVAHEKDLHLIVVRTDGAEFRHEHPTLGADGSWTIPWTWDAAGGYRLYADFVPSELGEGLTLTGSLFVEGAVEATAPASETTASAGPYQVEMTGGLTAGASSTVGFAVTRDGEPVELEPYLGADGHLVALREGDLAYLHVHPEHADGHEPGTVSFAAEVPSAGAYLLYLDVQIDGVVHTAAFRMEAS